MRAGLEAEVLRVTDEQGRRLALDVLRSTYREEKGWVNDEAGQVPVDDPQRPDRSWFVALRNGRPVGVLRVLYDPPLGLYREYQMQFLVGDIDIEAFLAENRIAEVGRFAVVPECRRDITVVAALMRAAVHETVARGYTHYITDVFENDEHSPYDFHTRVLGFVPVATHDVGELHCDSRRITLVLDFRESYRRLKERGGWIFRFITREWDESLHRRLA